MQDFADFEKAYGGDPNGGAKRKDQGEEGRWRCFTRKQSRLEMTISILHGCATLRLTAEEQLTEPEDIAAAIIGHLKAALEEIETLSEELEPILLRSAPLRRQRNDQVAARLGKLQLENYLHPASDRLILPIPAISNLQNSATYLFRVRPICFGRCDRAQ